MEFKEETGLTRAIRCEIRNLPRMRIPMSTNLIRMDSLEAPEGMSAGLMAQLGRHLAEVPLQRYPDSECSVLKERIRTQFDIAFEHELIIGNGSSELIGLVLQACAVPSKGGGPLCMSVSPSFFMYDRLSAIAGMRFSTICLHANFTLDVKAILDRIDQERPQVFILSIPNNPTGTTFPAEAVRQIVDAMQYHGIVVVDEAYGSYANYSTLDWVGQYPHLIVLRSLSKIGLAGLRIGFAVTQPWLGEQIDKLRLPFNIDSLSAFAASFALDHFSELVRSVNSIRDRRDRLAASLEKLNVTVFESGCNFLLIRVPDSSRFCLALKNVGILVKDLDQAHHLLRNCVRVTITTDNECDQFMKEINLIL